MTGMEEKHKWPVGISQSECQKSSQLFRLAIAKRDPEQVVHLCASGAKNKNKQKKEHKRNYPAIVDGVLEAQMLPLDYKHVIKVICY